MLKMRIGLATCATFLVFACGGGGSEPGGEDAAPPAPQCSDGIDNDGDGKVDYPGDPGCSSPNQEDENDVCPAGGACPACGNGVDDDGDGQTDYPADTGCTSASDDDEFVANPDVCGANVTVHSVPVGTYTDVLSTSGTSELSASCGGGGDEVVYEIQVATAAVLMATTISPTTLADTVLSIRSACLTSGSELACNDNADVDGGSLVAAAVEPGVYYVIVDAVSVANGGNFQVTIELQPGAGTPCPAGDECGVGLECGPPEGGGANICNYPACGDGIDNDGDGKIDYPNEPGCESRGDNDEDDNCPGGNDCPACGNGMDDDGDGQTDYPADTGCPAASQIAEGCGGEQDPIRQLTQATTPGSTFGGHDDIAITGCTPAVAGGIDHVFLVNLPAMTRVQFNTNDSDIDTVVAVYAELCETSIACDDDGGTSSASLITLDNLAAGTYSIVVAGYDSSEEGGYAIHVSGDIARGARCDGALALSGAILCSSSDTCVSGVCTPNACADGVDNDGDGLVDFPSEPGCLGVADDDEADDCAGPGPNCPECSDGVDNDGDGDIDYPADLDCSSAASDVESCTSPDGITQITSSQTAGDTAGNSDDLVLSCGSADGDDLYRLNIPVPLTQLVIDTDGSESDTVVGVLSGLCTSTDIACDDDSGPGLTSLITLTDVPAGLYWIVVEDFSPSTTETYVLNLHGLIPDGASCESAEFAAGIFTCGSSSGCRGPDGNKACEPAACADNTDADGDGFAGYPSDPGCVDRADDDESDGCPTDPGCPACSNDQDDDSDGQIDYPNDFGCIAASSTTEVFCNGESNPVLPVATAVYTGSTVGATDDFTPSCQSSSAAPDRVHSLALPVEVSELLISTEGSSFDTVLSLLDSSCASDLDCDDDGGSNPIDSSIIDIRTNVAAGTYAIIVDGFGTEEGTYRLLVHGVALPGSACTSELFSQGALQCAVNESCQSGVCAP
jgi:hypothetical protein